MSRKDCIDLEKNANMYKKDVFDTIILSSDFLQNFILNQRNSKETINNWIAKKLIIEETSDINKANYIYWVGGSLSWFYFSYLLTLNTDEKIISTKITNYDIHYIYQDLDEMKIKTIKLLNIVKELQFLLQSQNVISQIILDNFEYDDVTFKDTNTMKTKTIYNIKLVLNDIIIHGGARKPKQNKNIESRKLFTKELLQLKKRNQNVFSISKIIENKEKLKKKIIVEITLELFKYKNNTPLNIEKFKSKYLIVDKNEYHITDDYPLIIKKLNKLNSLGLLTYSYINTTDKIQTLGLDVDEFRQNIYMTEYLKNKKEKIKQDYNKLLETYNEIFQNSNFYNSYFKQKIEKHILKYSTNMYDEFIDYIERWFMLLFRPAINSFIKEINQDLEKYGIVLFIAGGDAMRRFDFDISSTKDIDVKLYINNIKDLTTDIEIKRKTDEQNKKDIIEIIANHIVKLRNYLQENYLDFFKFKTIEYNEMTGKNEEIINDYTTPIIFKNGDETYEIILKTDDYDNIQYFRTREIKQSKMFPVDLYSIDYTTIIKKTDATGKITVTKLLVALLDVVLQHQDFHNEYVTIYNNVPVASLYFLKKDLETIYTTPDMAVRRILTGKYKKDIKRYKTICNLSEDNIVPRTLSTEKINEIDYIKLLEYIDRRQDIDDTIKSYFNIILYKLKNNVIFNIYDIVICIYLVKHLNVIDSSNVLNKDEIKKIISNIAYFKVNIYNESLNTTIANYTNYDSSLSDNIIIQNYLELFKKRLGDSTKAVISYKNDLIIKDLEKYELLNKKVKLSKKPTIKKVPAPKAPKTPKTPKAPKTPKIDLDIPRRVTRSSIQK